MIKSPGVLLAGLGYAATAVAQQLPPDHEGMDAAASRENPHTNIPFETGRQLPTCDNRWDKFLPVLGQAACERGYVLPRPFGLSVGYMHQDQPFDVNGVIVNGVDVKSPGLAVVDEVQNEESAVTLRADVWLLPFWNVYGIAGKTDGEAVGPLTIDLTILSGQSPPLLPPLLEGICSNPANCNFFTEFNLDYQGDVLGFGTTIAGGYKDFFGMIDMNYTETDLNISVTDAMATVISARIGWNGKLGYFSGVLWVGAMYEDIAQELTLQQVTPEGVLEVVIDQETQAPLNFVFGGQWDFTRSFSALLEIGVGERDSQMLNLTYRF